MGRKKNPRTLHLIKYINNDQSVDVYEFNGKNAKLIQVIKNPNHQQPPKNESINDKLIKPIQQIIIFDFLAKYCSFFGKSSDI